MPGGIFADDEEYFTDPDKLASLTPDSQSKKWLDRSNTLWNLIDLESKYNKSNYLKLAN